MTILGYSSDRMITGVRREFMISLVFDAVIMYRYHGMQCVIVSSIKDQIRCYIADNL